MEKRESKPQKDESDDESSEVIESNFRVYNHTDEVLGIFWIDEDGEEVEMDAALQPAAYNDQESYNTHKFIAKSSTKGVLSTFIATPGVTEWHIGKAPTISRFAVGNIGDSVGPTSYPTRLRPNRHMQCILLLVDFVDAKAKIDPEFAYGQIVGEAASWYLLESFGLFTVNIVPCTEWRRMPAKAASYGDISTDFDLHKTYISDALHTWSDIDFSAFDIVYVGAPPNVPKNLFTSPTWHPHIGDGVFMGSCEVRHVVTFGEDAYTRDYRVLCHETGHVLGLEDLYDYNLPYPVDRALVSGWDIMSDVDLAQHFFGWHKYKLGWFSDEHLVQFEEGRLTVTLTPISAPHGLKMIQIPLTMQGGRIRSAVIIEQTQPYGMDFDAAISTRGLLAYKIDSTKEGGCGCVEVLGDGDVEDNEALRELGSKSHAFVEVGSEMVHRVGSKLIVIGCARSEFDDHLVASVHVRPD